MSVFNFNGFFLKKHFFYLTDKRLFPTQWSFTLIVQMEIHPKLLAIKASKNH